MSAVPRTALPGLVLGATLIGFAAICVRLADVGPTAAGFWRLALALPALAAIRRWQGPSTTRSLPGARTSLLGLAGLSFAIDLALWHRSIHLTSVANATLLSNLSPVFVALTLHFGFGERHAPRFWLGLALALFGAGWLVADSLRISAESAWGDVFAAATAIFYAGYQLIVSRQRRYFSAVEVMYRASLAGAALLLVLTLASGETFWPQSARGWAVLAVLALVVHVGGQGLIAWAQAHLPASFSSVTLLVQPVAASVYAWCLFGEGFGIHQALGAVIVLTGILLCRFSLPQRPPAIVPAVPGPVAPPNPD